MFFGLCALTFLAMTITDICWAICVAQTQQQAPAKAAHWAFALFVTTGIATVCYTTDPWLLIPAATGAWTGTYLGVWWTKLVAQTKETPHNSVLSYWRAQR